MDRESSLAQHRHSPLRNVYDSLAVREWCGRFLKAGKHV